MTTNHNKKSRVHLTANKIATKVLAIGVVAIGFLTACGNHGRRSGDVATVKNVFGVDDRMAITSTGTPWRMIGRLSNGCTGTLVGRDLVLTAAHCVYDRDAQAPKILCQLSRRIT